VVSNPTNAELSLEATTSGKVLSIGVTSAFNYFQSNVGYDFQIAGGSKMTITSGGEVQTSSNLRVNTGGKIIFESGGTANSLYRDPANGNTVLSTAVDTLFVTSTGAERMRITSGGVILISNLAGTGSRAVLADASGNLSAPVSDISVKENVKPIGYGLSEILKMNPVWFNFINQYKNYGKGRQNGLIAQEVAEIMPEAVFTTPSTGKMGINYDQMHGVYIKAIQELEARIKQLENK
jgi:hypothetical protein